MNEPGQMQQVDKPIVVTVFGILNIILGVLGLFFSFNAITQLMKVNVAPGVEPVYIKILLVFNVIGLVFSIFLASLGAGLLLMKQWARSGSIFYGWFGCVFFIVEMSVNFLAIHLSWTILPEGRMGEYIAGLAISAAGGFVYPALLLIFMKTGKVREAFEK